MATINDILTAVETIVKGLTPTVSGRAFHAAPKTEPLRNVAKDTHFDRAFRVRDARDQQIRKFYGPTSLEVGVTVLLEIGYIGKQDDVALCSKMSADQEQILKELQKSGRTDWPSGLVNIIYQGAGQHEDLGEGGANRVVATQRYLVTYEVS